MKNLAYHTYYRWGRFCFFAFIFILLVASCTKDPAQMRDSERVQFSIEQASDWGTPSTYAQTKSSEQTDLNEGPVVLRGESSKDTLFLHSSIKENTGFQKDSTGAITRSTPIDNSSFYSSFGVFAYAFDTWSESVEGDFMYNLEVTKADNWQTKYYWPGDGRLMRFFAYAPYNCTGLTLPSAPLIGTPTVDYTVPDDVADQTDLLATWTTDQTQPASSAAVPLAFHHILTAVRFVTGDQILQGKITKVTLKDIPATGTYTPNTAGVGSWTDLKNNKTFTKTLSVTVDGSADQQITSPDATFMMIPQTLPSGATVEIEYADDLSGVTRTLSASIAGQNWPEGKTVTYRISTSSIDIVPTLTVTGPADFTYQGGSNSYSVTSYGTMKLPGSVEQKIPLAWTAQFVEDDGMGGYRVIDKPDWLTDFTLSGDGGTDAKNYNATLIAQTGISDSPHTKALQQAQNVNEASGYTPYNLSNSTGAATVENTANCYVINAPGTYSLPLVYGNAIKNGATNSSAYISSASGSYVLHNFINHLGAAITNPYVYLNANCTPKDAVLVWQDRLNLVTNVTYSTDNQTITFDVPQETIGQGNAVIAIRDASDQIMWSWHIWVTDYKLGADLKTVTYQNHSYTILPVNLGWCDSESTSYSERKCSVRFKQAQTGETTIIMIKQIENAISVGGNNPYYQWGRKDPILPSTGTEENLNKTWYDALGIPSSKLSISSWGTGSESIRISILRPAVFKTDQSMDNTYYNLWAVNNTSTSIDELISVKTIYDPCPIAYKIPVPNACRSFTTTGDNVVNASEINGIWNASIKGYDFKCNNGETIYYPAVGYRAYSNGAVLNNGGNNGEGGWYWDAIPYSVSMGLHLFFTKAGVSPYPANYRAYGFVVRPIQE